MGEVKALLEHVVHSSGRLAARNLALIVTLWQTALRVAEVARLTFGQLDLGLRVIRAVRIKGGHVVDVLLNAETAAILGAYVASREDALGETSADAPLFARRDGRPLTVRAIQALFERWRRELGWTRALHPHVLRHTHATGALALGIDIATVADLLRHKGLRTVMTYAAVQDGARREALTRLGSLVPRAILPDSGLDPSHSPEGTGNVIPLEKSACVEEPFDEVGEVG